MTDFEKALEEKAYDYSYISDGITHPTTRESYLEGARWARDFTVREICEWIVGNGEFIVRNHCPANLKRAIESHFKDRGGEK